eukprot:3525388-Rhodomonas_salina.4
MVGGRARERTAHPDACGPGTLPAYALPTRCPALRHCTVLSAYGVSYALSGTEILNGAIRLRDSYALPGTDLVCVVLLCHAHATVQF